MRFSKFIVTTFVADEFSRGAARGPWSNFSPKAISEKRRAARLARSKASPKATPDKVPARAKARPDAEQAPGHREGRASAGLPADEGILSFRALGALDGSRPALDFGDKCKVGHVDCVNGFVKGFNEAWTCTAACDDLCCADDLNNNGCRLFTGKVCKDGSCNGFLSCYGAAIPYVVASCVGQNACYQAGSRLYGATSSLGSVFNSCQGSYACASAGRGIVSTSSVGVAGVSGSGSVGHIYNSCHGDSACEYAGLGYGTPEGNGRGSVGNITNACNATKACQHAGSGREGTGGVGNINNACNATAACKKTGYNSVLDSSLVNCCYGEEECEARNSLGDLPGACNPPADPSPPTSPTNATVFPWAIDFVGLNADFSLLSQDEISLKYIIGKDHMYETSLHDKDCKSSIEDVTVESTTIRASKNGTHDSLTINHSIDMGAIADSSIANDKSDRVEVCQRLKLILPAVGSRPEMVIMEDIRSVTVDFNLSADFSVVNELGPGTTETAVGETDVTSYVFACNCLGVENFTCTTEALVPNTQLHVCITSVSTDVEIKQLMSMVVTQGGATMPVVDEGNVVISSIAGMTYVKPANGVVVSSFIPTNIFDYTAGASINISGAIDTKMVGSEGRLLANSFDGDTSNADSDGKASYELSVNLQDELVSTEKDNAWVGSSASSTLSSASVLFSMTFLYTSGMW